MAKSQDSFNKKEQEKKRKQKNQEKEERKQQRKADKAKGGTKTLEEMFAYVDENGHLTSVKPDPSKKKVFKAEDIVLGASPRDNAADQGPRKGLVKFFNDEKGYGFITDVETKDSIFVHINNITGTLRENDRVLFEVDMGPKGPYAVNVQLAG
jgi:cold shock CspA family protein